MLPFVELELLGELGAELGTTWRRNFETRIINIFILTKKSSLESFRSQKDLHLLIGHDTVQETLTWFMLNHL